jgi:Secretion system C-terminal sorting domain
LVLPAGTFYAGTVQPAYSNSDSLYFGLDVNRVGGNHAYFRLEGAGAAWNPSLISGAIMIRPLLGADITDSKVAGPNVVCTVTGIKPNPAHAAFYIQSAIAGDYGFRLTDLAGRTLLTGNVSDGQPVDISDLSEGMYLVRISDKSGAVIAIEKLLKN